jgi:hypothetical protein
MKENKRFIYPIVFLFVIIFLSFLSAKIVADNISNLNAELQKNRDMEVSLQTKFSSLQRISPAVSSSSQVVIAVLPASSPLLNVVSNIRTQALTLGLSLDNFSSGAVVGVNQNQTLSSGEIIFDADGGYENISSLIAIIRNSAPITRFDAIKILNQASTGGDSYRFSAHLSVYWASLPKTIPSAQDPFTGLSADEEKILSDLSSLNIPTLSGDTSSSSASATPSGPSRANPFSL